MSDLKPCPFCGGEAVAEHEQECRDAETYVWFVCGGCGCETEGEHGRPAALAAWNTRASAPPQEGEREKVAAELFARFSPNRDWKAWADCGVLGRGTYLEAADAILSSLRGEGAAS